MKLSSKQAEVLKEAAANGGGFSCQARGTTRHGMFRRTGGHHGPIQTARALARKGLLVRISQPIGPSMYNEIEWAITDTGRTAVASL